MSPRRTLVAEPRSCRGQNLQRCPWTRRTAPGLEKVSTGTPQHLDVLGVLLAASAVAGLWLRSGTDVSSTSSRADRRQRRRVRSTHPVPRLRRGPLRHPAFRHPIPGRRETDDTSSVGAAILSGAGAAPRRLLTSFCGSPRDNAVVPAFRYPERPGRPPWSSNRHRQCGWTTASLDTPFSVGGGFVKSVEPLCFARRPPVDSATATPTTTSLLFIRVPWRFGPASFARRVAEALLYGRFIG